MGGGNVTIPSSPFTEELEGLKARTTYLIFGVFLLFFLLLTRLWYLQVLKGHEFRVLSENNRTRGQDILPSRGLILDRNGRILVDNHPAFDLSIILEDVHDLDLLGYRLTRLLNISDEEIKTAFDQARKQPAFKPALIRGDLTRSELVALETYRYELPGIVIQVKPRRKYLNESLAAHIIGYLGEISQEQLSIEKHKGNRIGDLVGQSGLEREWEQSLQGKRGWQLVEVDAFGRVLGVARQNLPLPGDNLYLTLDASLQKAAEEALAETAGALVALDPRNGEILAMASNPGFSQDEFVRGISSQKWQALLNDPLHPLENRAISGQYMPGSTFKIVSALAALEEGIITPETTVSCTGGYSFGNRVFHCWQERGHGQVNLHRAIVESCDIYFYDIGRQIGIDRLAHYSRMLGLGRNTGLGLRSEKPGLVPTAGWKERRFNSPWHQGETLSVIIGQGFNLVTPLQMANLVAAVVNGGVLYRPHLVKRVTDIDNKTNQVVFPEVIRYLEVKPEHLDIIKQALAGVVNEPRGTGKRAWLKDMSVGGKTGTSQVVSQSSLQDKDEEEVPYDLRDHAWFVAFAPVEEPRIAVAVIAEHSGHGGSAAAPMAKRVLEAFLELEKNANKSLTAQNTITRFEDDKP